MKSSKSFYSINLEDKAKIFEIHDKNSLLCGIVLLLLFFFVLWSVYFLYVYNNRRLLATASGRATSNLIAPPAGNRASSGLGHHQITINGLPIFLYGSMTTTVNNNTNFQEADCCICLSAFQDGEKVKLLPPCCHGFHSECADKWLRTRLSCPLCRASVIRVDSAADPDIP